LNKIINAQKKKEGEKKERKMKIWKSERMVLRTTFFKSKNSQSEEKEDTSPNGIWNWEESTLEKREDS